MVWLVLPKLGCITGVTAQAQTALMAIAKIAHITKATSKAIGSGATTIGASAKAIVRVIVMASKTAPRGLGGTAHVTWAGSATIGAHALARA